MHAGSIDNPDTKAGRLFRIMRERVGEWLGGWELHIAIETTCLSTHVAEVRQCVKAQKPQVFDVEHEQRGQYNFYRLVYVDAPPRQLPLFDDAPVESFRSAGVWGVVM